MSRSAAKRWFWNHYAQVLLVVGASLINLALAYGVGVHFGWWGWVFWIGLGLVYAGIKVDSRDSA